MDDMDNNTMDNHGQSCPLHLSIMSIVLLSISSIIVHAVHIVHLPIMSEPPE